MIKILIVDDHDLVRLGIKRILDEVAGFKIVGEAKNGDEAIQQVKANHPNVVLMDIKMPIMNGKEATQKILKIDPDIKILILTTYDDNHLPHELLQLGAVGYLTKSSSMDEMVNAIRTVNSGQRYISPEIAKQIALKSSASNSKPIFDTLSERELQVALKLMDGRKVQEIAEELNLSPKTVNSYRYRIFEKLKINSDVELTLLALKHKILDMPEDNL